MNVPITATANKQVLLIIECALPRWLDFVSGRQVHGKTNLPFVAGKEKMRPGIAAVLLWFTCCLPLPAAEVSTTSHEAKKYFEEARTLCERDSGTLWNKSLCGPLLLVDPESRDAFADQADGEHR